LPLPFDIELFTFLPERIVPLAFAARASSARLRWVWAGGDTEPLSIPVVVGLLVWVPVFVLLAACMLVVEVLGVEAGEV